MGLRHFFKVGFEVTGHGPVFKTRLRLQKCGFGFKGCGCKTGLRHFGALYVKPQPLKPKPTEALYQLCTCSAYKHSDKDC